jgi:carbamoyltransferase
MNVIGYSGLHHSVSFKQTEFPDLSAREYRIAQGFDSAAALVTSTGIQAASAEERFNEQKGTNLFPVNAINYCLQAGGLTSDQVDVVAHGFAYQPVSTAFEHNPFLKQQYNQVYAPEIQQKLLCHFFPETGWDKKLVSVPHHLAHAASAYYVSGFDESLILILDGMGETHSTTVAFGQGANINILETITAPHSLGILYGVFTLYLGFWMSFDEYKVMGLAPYGNPRRYFNKLMEFVHLRSDGTYTIPLLFGNKTTTEQETYAGTLRILEETFGPRRQPGEEITQRHKDIAAGLQTVLQAGIMHTLRYFQRETKQSNLCMAGGVALNCTANGVIKRSRMFRDIFIQPAAADDGTALGAALYVQHNVEGGNHPQHKMQMPFWGPSFGDDEIEKELLTCTDVDYVYYEDFTNLVSITCQRIATGQVVAWFQGRMEYGPRALGNRSILADPRGPDTREHLNRLVKKREGFRPFAPAVTLDEAHHYFEVDEGDDALYRYMLCVAPVKKQYREQLPAVTHVDGSARVQIVSRDGNERFWHLLNAYKDTTGLPVLLNTSFNLRGQPIIRTPATALSTFVNSEIDVLVMGNFWITRKVES